MSPQGQKEEFQPVPPILYQRKRGLAPHLARSSQRPTDATCHGLKQRARRSHGQWEAKWGFCCLKPHRCRCRGVWAREGPGHQRRPDLQGRLVIEDVCTANGTARVGIYEGLSASPTRLRPIEAIGNPYLANGGSGTKVAAATSRIAAPSTVTPRRMVPRIAAHSVSKRSAVRLIMVRRLLGDKRTPRPIRPIRPLC